MNTLTKRLSHSSVTAFSMLVLVASFFSGAISAQAAVYTLENGGSFWTQYGSGWNVKSSCGLRGSCHWVYNDDYTITNEGYWNYDAAHNYYNEHFYNVYSDQQVFIPTVGTTRKAIYTVRAWNVGGGSYQTQNTLAFNQNAYLNTWVDIMPFVTNMTETIFIRLNNATTEPDRWYSVVWDATKLVY